MLELKLDLGVIDHFAQIPDNRFPSSLLKQAGEPLVQVFFLVFLVLNILYQGFRKNKSEAVEGGGLMSGRDVHRTFSQNGFLRKGRCLGRAVCWWVSIPAWSWGSVTAGRLSSLDRRRC